MGVGEQNFGGFLVSIYEFRQRGTTKRKCHPMYNIVWEHSVSK